MMDYVLPFVDCEDPVWIEQYKGLMNTKYCLKQMERSRFRPFGTLRYAFRSVAKNLPFIDRIVLIVSTESQVPAWVNRENVRIVTHEEFIPAKYLPTFNSSAIESFMWRIDGLSDLFLYGNDDFFVLKPLSEADFFDGDLPRLKFEQSDYNIRNMFRICCRNGMDMAADAAGCARTDKNILLKPQHCIKGIETASMKEVGRKCFEKIGDTITTMRHWDNITGYLYHYYAYYLGKYAPFDATYEYIRISNNYGAVLKEYGADMLCINDAGELDNEHYAEASRALVEWFDKKFPETCKYEKE